MAFLVITLLFPVCQQYLTINVNILENSLLRYFTMETEIHKNHFSRIIINMYRKGDFFICTQNRNLKVVKRKKIFLYSLPCLYGWWRYKFQSESETSILNNVFSTLLPPPPSLLTYFNINKYYNYQNKITMICLLTAW